MNKTILNDLAVFGGSPAFPEPLHVGRPNACHRERFLKRVNDLLDRRWLTNQGPFVTEFEQRVAEFLGVRHCVAMCNGTTALEIAIRAAGLSGEVIVPAFTFISTAHALKWQGVTPVFCDVDPRTHHIDPSRLEGLITERTTGVIGVHLWGRPCAVEALEEITRKRRLKLLFDAAHAFGNSHQGRRIGSFGDAEVFSFHATKFFHTLEGGAVVTNDDGLARVLRLMHNMGFSGYDQVVCAGTNAKMNEISAAMGLTMFESLEAILAINQRHYRHYERELSEIPGLQLMRYDEGERNNYQYIVLDIDEPKAGISRDQLVVILHKENVLARRYFYPGCHQMEPYRSDPFYGGLHLPVTDHLAGRLLILPTGEALQPDQVTGICRIIRWVMDHAPEIAQRLSKNTEGGK
ncbi:MAG TPA: dTDP-4-dehydro-6-deoxyglucose aminotransferase [Candidatus Omnitrophica bacterium]|nr:MAG: dTDP-4-dehydro-6-deoxyglucose aminotransferase [Omnitrophica WOR_2 bacterium GWA2_45_18]HBR15087.1 dTDP-4-dehydro-6-deoxyglucose aminotransferase [Candidatus Omnitrophota bacterium]